ncbi:MAG: AmmeMemoRadiSam system protein A [Candidatus Sumerlaeia bacterium]|nr:AmmeMemoRadiSam system protein A [Candidatus Sumerlaeia bacterium]
MERLTPGECATLLRLARRAVTLRAQTGREVIDAGDETLTETLHAPGGAFVTLREGDALRGCIGHIQAVRPLWESVMENAVSAGWHDHRFRHVREDQLPRLRIEVTVIHPLEPIEGPGQIEVGRHGVLIEHEGARGVLLPQVASERSWDARTFLDQVCEKACLPRGAWRDPGAQLWRFAAEHFEEGGTPGAP